MAMDTGTALAEGWPVQEQSSQSRMSDTVLLTKEALAGESFSPVIQTVADPPAPLFMALPTLTLLTASSSFWAARVQPRVWRVMSLARSMTWGGIWSKVRSAVYRASFSV